ncbi:MAG TPA: hypothetical protein EYP56_19795 [Planctomycetaceae bacterium]|nr:hypothetical protein [Planctomycetaceae bacterium]HIQ22057.1 hypothetical protein [Planctomycetota bacterium]
MCLLAIQYQTAPDAPILLAHNREERFDRPTQPPRIQSGRPRAVCGIDRKAGGTWLGVNQYGLVAVVGNRPKTLVPAEPRSRGLLCRELLNCRTAEEAAEKCRQELAKGAYAGANFVCLDDQNGIVIYGGDVIHVQRITPGLHLLTNGQMDDNLDERQQYVRRLLTLQRLDSAVAFLAVASRTFSRKADPSGGRGVVVTGGVYGTVSSTLIALGEKTQNCIYQYAHGPPCDHPYEDYSALLRQVLSTERSSQ